MALENGEQPQDEQELDILGMSDEEIANLDPNTLKPLEVVTDTQEVNTDTVLQQSAEQSVVSGVPSNNDDDSVGTKDNVPGVAEPNDVDTKSFYEQVTAKFKANGVELSISEPTEVVKLMQMGLNYTKKMQELAEPRRLHKMLVNGGIADEGSLAYLIDLHNKKPEAIAKLVKDSGIDLYGVADEAVAQYSPESRAPQASTIVLDDVLLELSDDPHYERVVTLVGEQWDEASRGMIVENPTILKTLAQHMHTGVFDQIDSIMKVEVAKGNFVGIPKYDAFVQIGNYLYSQGLLVGHTQKPTETQKPINTANAQAQAHEAEMRRRRAAATNTARSSTTATSQGVNYLAMSDAEIAKMKPY